MRFLFDGNEWILQMACSFIQNYLPTIGYRSDVGSVLFWVFFPNIMQNVMCGNLVDGSGAKSAV